MAETASIRTLVTERLCSAAEDIISLFERTIAEYEQQLLQYKQTDREQKKLLSLFQPWVQLHRTAIKAEAPEELKLTSVAVKTEEENVVDHHRPSEETKSSNPAGRSSDSTPEQTDVQTEKVHRAVVKLEPLQDFSNVHVNTVEEEELHHLQTEEKREETEETDICGRGHHSESITSPTTSSSTAELQVTHLSLIYGGGGYRALSYAEPGTRSHHQQETFRNTFVPSTNPHRGLQAEDKRLSPSDTHRTAQMGKSVSWSEPSRILQTDKPLNDSGPHRTVQMNKRFICSAPQRAIQAEDKHLSSADPQRTVRMDFSRSDPHRTVQTDKHLSGSDPNKTIQMDKHLSSADPYRAVQMNKSVNWSESPRTVQTNKPFSWPDSRRPVQMSKSSSTSGTSRAGQGGDTSISCSLCHKRFPHHSYLVVHMQTHTLDRPYRCTVCNKGFRTNLYLQNHIRIHTGEKPFSCPFCERAFAQKSNLRSHLSIHTGERPYSCPACPKTFRKKWNLKKHVQTHDTEGLGESSAAHTSLFLDGGNFSGGELQSLSTLP